MVLRKIKIHDSPALNHDSQAIAQCDRLASASENELTSDQAKRTLYDVESGYIKTISEACQSKDFIRAELSAKRVFEKLWLMYQIFFTPP
ncbi:MAG: hypothetical protein V6D39_04055 [Dolichospermum lemmermannii FEM_B0920]